MPQTPLSPEEYLHEAMNGQTPIGRHDTGGDVTPTEAVPTGVGPGNVQPFQTGRTQNVRSTWTEQGWGHSSQRWPSYPFSVGDNPSRNFGTARHGERQNRINFASDAWRVALVHGQQSHLIGQKKKGGHGRIVPLAPSVPYTETVPSYGGGPVQHAGVDVPWWMVHP